MPKRFKPAFQPMGKGNIYNNSLPLIMFLILIYVNYSTNLSPRKIFPLGWISAGLSKLDFQSSYLCHDQRNSVNPLCNSLPLK